MNAILQVLTLQSLMVHITTAEGVH